MAEEARLRHGLGAESTGFLLESPEDPGKNKPGSVMPSFWNWEELQILTSEEGMNMINFDQRPMGHCRKKPTTLITNLPNMLELQELRSPPGQDEPLADSLNERMEQSRSWALWAPGLRAAVWTSLKIYMDKLLQVVPRIYGKRFVQLWNILSRDNRLRKQGGGMIIIVGTIQKLNQS